MDLFYTIQEIAKYETALLGTFYIIAGACALGGAVSFIFTRFRRIK